MAVALARDMVTAGFLEYSDAVLVEAFQHDLASIGYAPPVVVQGGNAGVISTKSDKGSSEVFTVSRLPRVEREPPSTDWFADALNSITTGLQGPASVGIATGVVQGLPEERFETLIPLAARAPVRATGSPSRYSLHELPATHRALLTGPRQSMDA